MITDILYTDICHKSATSKKIRTMLLLQMGRKSQNTEHTSVRFFYFSVRLYLERKITLTASIMISPI